MLPLFTTLILYIVICGAGFVFIEKNKELNIKNPRFILFVIMSGAFFLRLYFALQNYYFKVDINCFTAWSDATTYYGFDDMYHSGMFLDYPPGYMYVLFFIKLIRSLLNLPYDSVFTVCLLKLPAIIRDIAGSLFIYKLAKKHFGEAKALLCAAAFAFCPATVYNSSVWGQIDSFYTLLLMLTLCRIYENKTVKAAVLYAVALVTKPQALLFGPVLLFYIVEKKSLKELLKAVGTGLLCVYLLILPFSQSLSPLWIIKLYMQTFGGYQYMTVNGYNLYMLAGMNWKPLTDYYRAGLVNPLVISACFALCAAGYAKIKDNSKIFTSCLVFISVFFSFCTMMHERYLHPAIILALISYILTNKKEYFYIFLANSATGFLNIAAVMRGFENGYTVPPLLYKTIGFVTVAACVYTLWTYVKEIKSYPPLKISRKRKEIISVGCLVAVYSFFAFYKLGDTKSPQTFFQSEGAGQWFTVKFDEPVNIKSIWAFSGMGDQYSPRGNRNIKKGCDFTVSYSQGGQWVESATFDHNYVFTWQKKDVDFTADYILVRRNSPYQVLNEITFCDNEGKVVTGAIDMPEDMKQMAYSPLNTMDESHTLPKDTGYYSSMYFDEIYHARTAFEQLNGYTIYETTHPPLGKTLISLGIAIFGMTPFGWRFMGTLRGVAMVVIMYLLAKELLKNEKAAFLCAFLCSFDFMHYTQTRLATVDSFLAMFVMLMFLFMMRYAKIPLDKDVKKQYLNLFLSGLFMGCAVAVKWNGAYGALGLAAYFFITLYLKYRRYVAGDKKREKTGFDLAFKTCLMCLLFFVVIPFAVYFLSFVPVFRCEKTTDFIGTFIRWQTNMFDYHANLDADHFFSSMWYTWPLIIKPIWYSVTRVGNMVSSISSFGNPLVWLPMVPALILAAVNGFKQKDKTAIPLVCGYLGCFLPWVLVSRTAFIYHYFPATIFGILAIGAFFNKQTENPKGRKAITAYCFAVFVLFIVFFPVLSGVPASQNYIDRLELLPTWYFN